MQGIKLKVARVKGGVKQWVLAQRLGVPQWRVSLWESSKKVSDVIAQSYRNALRELGGQSQK